MTVKLPPTPEGWILGTEAGYRHHAGFIKDAPGGRRHWSLVPCHGGIWTLALIDARGDVVSKEQVFFADALRNTK